MFGNAPKELWKNWIHPDEKNRIELSCRAFVLKDGTKNILFEAGTGVFFEPKLKERYGVVGTEHRLLNNLNAVGLSENDIDIVVLSHLHFDHVGGLLTAYGTPLRLLFPKALYFIGKNHWEMAQKPHSREQASFLPQLHRLLIESGRLVLIDGPQNELTGKTLTFHFSDGHTIGLMMSEININNECYVFISDLVPGNPWVHLPMSMGYDRFPELLVDEKKKFYEHWLNKDAKFLFTHDPHMPCGRLLKTPEGKFKCEPFPLH